jgi:hypothetical protein
MLKGIKEAGKIEKAENVTILGPFQKRFYIFSLDFQDNLLKIPRNHLLLTDSGLIQILHFKAVILNSTYKGLQNAA